MPPRLLACIEQGGAIRRLIEECESLRDRRGFDGLGAERVRRQQQQSFETGRHSLVSFDRVLISMQEKREAVGFP